MPTQILIIVMRTFNFCRTIQANFCNLAKKKPLILSHSNSFANYTFLGINMTGINSSFTSMCSQMNSSALSTFIKALNEQRYVIKHVQMNQYGHKQLERLEQQKSPVCEALSKYRQELIGLKHKYSLLCSHILADVSSQNLFVWLEVCTKLDIIESCIWGKFFSIIIQTFSSLDLKEQTEIIRYTHSYIKNRFISFTYAPSQFVYRENYLVDLTNFRALLKKFIESILKNDGDAIHKCKSLERTNDLLEKISKIYVMNFADLIEVYTKSNNHFDVIVRHGSIGGLIEILRYFSIIGLYDQQIYVQIENKIEEKWRQSQFSLSHEEEVKLISKILSVWASLNRHNQLIFKDLIKPFIDNQISQGIQSRQHSIWLYNIAACSIRDIQFLEKFKSFIGNYTPLSNKYLHIVSHLLAIIQNSRHSDAFPSCSQHEFAAKILQQHGKSHLNCMQRQRKEESNFNPRQLTFINDMGQEANPSEHFWLQVARKAYQIVSKRYPHPDNCIILNFPFCVFQIDAVMMLKGVAVAFELGGSHYYLKEGREIIMGQAQGKKVIKQAILTGYGIKMLEINSTNCIERNISSFNDTSGGVKFIVEKLERILSSIP